MNTPLQSIRTKKQDLRFWQVISLIQTFLFAGILIYQSTAKDEKSAVLIVGDSSYSMGKLQDFADANTLHMEQAEIATLCLLQRSPLHADLRKRLDLLYAKEAHKKALKMFQSEGAEFQLKGFHQKVEISDTQILRARGNKVLALARGQLLRTGVFEGKLINETLSFELQMDFVANPDISTNGYYPSLVTNFELTTFPPKS